MKPYFTNKAQIGDIIDIYNSQGISLSRYIPSKIKTYVYDKEKYKGLEFMVVDAKSKVSRDHDVGESDYAWHITARQLDSNGNYNPNGQMIKFFQSDNAPLDFKILKVKVIDKMKIKFERVNKKSKGDSNGK